MKRNLIFFVIFAFFIGAVCVFEFKRRAAFAINAAAQTKTRVELLSAGLWAFEAENGRLPTAHEGLRVLLGAPAGGGPIKEYSPADPPTIDAWRRAIRYELRDGAAVVRSAGADGEYDSEDDIHQTIAPRPAPASSTESSTKELTLTVSVVSQDGTPVGRANVAVAYNSGPTFRGSTGDDGKVAIRLPGDGYSFINVRHEGGSWSFGRLEFPDIKNVLLRLDDGHRR
ncbi:MAG: Type secretion system protein [Verrucomicrobiota bacterium]|jgi:hypothetical protein